MLAQIAEYTAAVNEAKAAIEPAKKEHQAKHKAAEALLAPVVAEIKKIEAIAGEYMDLAVKLQAILNAYYGINEFSYVDENGVTQKLNFTGDKDFSQVATWLKKEIAKYEKKDPAVVAPATSEGKIKDAEAAVAAAQKTLEHAVEGGNYEDSVNGYIAYLKMLLEQEQAKLEHFQAIYEFAVKSLNDYIAALTK